jgi:hypothetical protein
MGLANTTYAEQANRGTTSPQSVANKNQLLADAIAERISRSGTAVGTRDLNVTTQNGVAELTGYVKNVKQAEELVQQALKVSGVTKVETSLKVLPTQDLRAVDSAEPTPSPVIVPGAPAALPPSAAGPGVAPGPVAAPGLPPGVPPGVPPGAQLFSTDPVPLAAPGMPAYDLTGPKMPPYAWPTYAPYPNMSRVAYPQAYPYNAFPYIGPYYPFPKVPLGWRKVQLEWDDGHWYLGRLSTPHDYWRVKFW